MQSIAATTVIGTCGPLVLAGAAVAGTVTAGVFLGKHILKKNNKKEKEKEKALAYDKKLEEVELMKDEGPVNPGNRLFQPDD